MNPFLLPDDERLKDWKQFRDGLHTFPEEVQLQRVADYFAQAPLLKFAYDPEDAAKWPTIWEMLVANEWCRLSIAIAMEETLRIAGWDRSRLVLHYFKDRSKSDMFFTVEVDSRLALNYDHRSVSLITNAHCDTIAKWQHSGSRFVEV